MQFTVSRATAAADLFVMSHEAHDKIACTDLDSISLTNTGWLPITLKVFVRIDTVT